MQQGVYASAIQRFSTLLAAMVVLGLSQPLAAQPRTSAPSPADVLLLHGINATTDSLVAFLEKGFPPEAIARGLPTEPKDKTQVVIYAIEELGALRARGAVPLLIQICRGQLPQGIRGIIGLDTSGIDALLANQEQERLQQIVVLNCVVALGWIADPEAIPAIKEILESDKPSRFVTQGALALAMMGNADGLPYLVKLLEKGGPGEQAGAARILYIITGRYYSIGPNTSVARRKLVLQDLKQWFRAWGAYYQVNPDEVRRRREQPYPPSQEPIDLATVRGLCKTSVDVLGDYESSYRARQRLNNLGKESLPDLEAVALDEMEDTDVRLEAMRYYVQIAGRDSKPLLKKLDGDDNKPIAERATYILDHFDKFTRSPVAPK